MDIAPALAGAALPERSLFWRYKGHAQRAVRCGNLQYLKIDGHESLFNVVADPLERANLKDRESAAFAALRAEWEAWDKTMLPLDPKSYTHGITASEWADHFDAGD